MRIFWLLFLFLLATSCSNEKNTSILNEGELETQVYKISNKQDTVLKTAKGAILKITKGSFSGNDEEVELEIKEAYSLADIIQAGLTTQTNGRPLSSGGMIYLNAVDEDVSINKPIEISVPTDAYDEQMMLYKGKKEDGKMNWTDPELLSDSTSPYLTAGVQLFEANCAPCHSYNRQLTGPAMKGLESRGLWKDRGHLLAFTRNPGSYIPRTCYTQNLAAQYNGQIMPSFPQLSDADLNALYDYFRSLDIKNGVDLTNNYDNGPCDDSCYRYDSVRLAAEERINEAKSRRIELISKNENRINYERWDSSGRPMIRNENGPGEEKVKVDETKAIYYRFDIDSFGWYNIDKLLETSKGTESMLSVRVDESLSVKWDVFIAVPGQKVFDQGGKLAGGKDYGFFTMDGKLPLKVGTNVIVFVLGEANGQIAFDYKEFKTTGNDVIQLQPRLASKDEFNKKVKSWSLERITIAADDSKNAGQIRQADKEIKGEEQLIESYQPKTCNCRCGNVSGDSAQQKEAAPLSVNPKP